MTRPIDIASRWRIKKKYMTDTADRASVENKKHICMGRHGRSSPPDTADRAFLEEKKVYD